KAERVGWAWGRRPSDWFLVGWLVLELVGYFALTPFAAVRRVMGLVVAATAVLGRLASSSCRTRAEFNQVRFAALVSGCLGFFFFVIDWCDAWSWRSAALGSAAFIRQQMSQASIWYFGHWGFQYYAEQAGMQPVVANDTQLHAGDWLVAPDDRLNAQE